jgi:hypothetical protein
MRIAARYADEFNLLVVVAGRSPGRSHWPARSRVRGGRPRSPDDHPLDDVGVLMGATATCAARQQQLLRDFGNVDAGEDWFHERRDRWVFGTPDEARAQVERYAEAGAELTCSRTSCRAIWRWWTSWRRRCSAADAACRRGLAREQRLRGYRPGLCYRLTTAAEVADTALSAAYDVAHARDRTARPGRAGYQGVAP